MRMGPPPTITGNPYSLHASVEWWDRVGHWIMGIFLIAFLCLVFYKVEQDSPTYHHESVDLPHDKLTPDDDNISRKLRWTGDWKLKVAPAELDPLVKEIQETILVSTTSYVETLVDAMDKTFRNVTMVLRVPTDNFDNAMKDLSQLIPDSSIRSKNRQRGDFTNLVWLTKLELDSIDGRLVSLDTRLEAFNKRKMQLGSKDWSMVLELEKEYNHLLDYSRFPKYREYRALEDEIQLSRISLEVISYYNR